MILETSKKINQTKFNINVSFRVESLEKKSASYLESKGCSFQLFCFDFWSNKQQQQGLKNNLNPDNLILEINSCKHANNIQIDDLCYFLTKALLNLPVVLNNQATYLKTFKSYIQDLLKDLLVNYYTKTKKSQKIFLDATLDYFVEIKSADSLSILDADYVRIIHFLYNDVEVLDEVEKSYC